MEMTKQIAKSIRDCPVMIQVAKDEVWEKTWDINPNEIVGDSDISDYLENSPHNLISVETIFQEKNGNYIFGMTYCSGLKVTTEVEFLKTFIEINQTFTNFASFVDSINTKIIGHESLFSGDPDKIRIGVVNHWFSIGPCLVWEKGDNKTITYEELENRLLKNPNVMNTNLNYQGMSFVFNLNDNTINPCHWMKSPCYSYDGNNWKVEKQMVINYLHEWQEIEVK